MPPKTPTKFAPRKLLVAAVGVATLNCVAIACTPPTSGNLPAPTDRDAAAAAPTPTNVPPTSGNLPAPTPVDAATPTPTIVPPTSGNLMVPPPQPDAGKRR